jgi:antitoxin FitA
MPSMPYNLTLTHVPEDLYARLAESAALHRRSLNDEAIACLNSALPSMSIPPTERLARAQALRTALPSDEFRSRHIQALKHLGRP